MNEKINSVSVNNEDKFQLMQLQIDKKFEKLEKKEEKHRKKESKTEIQTENKDLTQVEPRYLYI